LKEEALLGKMQRRFEKTVNASQPVTQGSRPGSNPDKRLRISRLLARPSKAGLLKAPFI
jgi:hypothetical protein